MIEQQTKELRLSGGSALLEYIRRFSATEKAVFGIFVALALITAVAMASSVNSYFMTEVPADGGTLHEGLVGLPHTVNPILAVTDVDHDISALVYSGLTRNVNGAIEPDLASDWKVSADGLTYTFDLPEGLSFQDGAPLDAYDVVFTIDKIQDQDLKSPRAADWAGVMATATSPTTVVFTLKQPYSSFLSNTSVGIIPRHIWGSVSDDRFIFSDFNVKPIGAGPYKVVSVGRDQGGIPTTYRLSTWNGYHDDTPHIENIVFSFFPDEDHALDALRNGSIDSLPAVSPADAAKLASNSGEPYVIRSAPLKRVFGVFFNQNVNPVLADATVRKALDISVDRGTILNAAVSGYGSAIDGPLPPGIGTSTAAAATTSPRIAAASALLEKAGWKKNADGIYAKKPAKGAAQTLSLTLYTADAPELKQAADAVKAAWTDLGAQVDLKVFEPSDLYQNVIRARSYDALLFGEAVGRDNDLYAFWHSSQRNAPGLNVSMYVNSKVDKVLESIRSTTSSTARQALFDQLDSLVSADVPAVFLYSPDFVYAVPKALHGLELGAMSASSDRFGGIDGWYIQTENVWNIFSKK